MMIKIIGLIMIEIIRLIMRVTIKTVFICEQPASRNIVVVQAPFQENATCHPDRMRESARERERESKRERERERAGERESERESEEGEKDGGGERERE